MGNIIVLTLIIGILLLSIFKIIKDKRSGVKCIGCPLGSSDNIKCNC